MECLIGEVILMCSKAMLVYSSCATLLCFRGARGFELHSSECGIYSLHALTPPPHIIQTHYEECFKILDSPNLKPKPNHNFGASVDGPTALPMWQTPISMLKQEHVVSSLSNNVNTVFSRSREYTVQKNKLQFISVQTMVQPRRHLRLSS